MRLSFWIRRLLSRWDRPHPPIALCCSHIGCQASAPVLLPPVGGETGCELLGAQLQAQGWLLLSEDGAGYPYCTRHAAALLRAEAAQRPPAERGPVEDLRAELILAGGRSALPAPDRMQ